MRLMAVGILKLMFDYHSDIRFKIATLISDLKEVQLSQVLSSPKLSQLGLDFFDIVDSQIEIEKYFKIEIPSTAGVDSLEDFTDLVYKTTMLNQN